MSKFTSKTFMLLAGAVGVLVLCVFTLAKENAGINALISGTAVVACAVVAVQINEMLKAGKRLIRQTRETEFKAHDMNVSAEELQKTLQNKPGSEDLAIGAEKKPNRQEKIAYLIEELGFDMTMKIVKETGLRTHKKT